MAGDTNISLLQDIKEEIGNIGGGQGSSQEYSIEDLSGNYTFIRSAVSFQIAEENSNRVTFHFISLGTNIDTIWLNYGGAASSGSGSVPVEPGQNVELEVGEADKEINIYSETRDQEYTAKAKVLVQSN